MPTRKLFTSKTENIGSRSGVATLALAIIRLKQEIKRDVVLSYRLVCAIDGVLVIPAYFTSGNNTTQRVRSRFGLHFLVRANHARWRFNLTL
jgi:hypothetical protein